MAIKITFLGAGSSVFVRNVLGDCIIHPELEDLTFAVTCGISTGIWA